MKYKPDIEAVLARYRAFWAGDISDRPPIRIRFAQDSIANVDWSEAVQTKETHFQFWEAYAQSRVELFDDEIPTAALDMGTAFAPWVLGASIHFSAGASWNTHIITCHDDINKLNAVKYDITNPAIASYLERADYFRKMACGKMAVGIAMLTGGSDIAGSVRGLTQSFIDMYENEALYRDLLHVCTTAWIRIQALQFDTVPALAGGYCDNYGMWTPGRGAYFASDLSCGISNALYRRLLYEEDCRISRSLTHPWFHAHSIQARLIPGFLEIPGLIGLQIVNDGDSGPGFDEVFPYAKMVQEYGKCLILRKYSIDELKPYLPHLSSRRLFIDTQCNTLDDAKEVLRDFSGQKYMRF